MEAARQAFPGLTALPPGEERAGITGNIIQATGLNVRAATNAQMLAPRDKAAQTRYGRSWDDIGPNMRDELRKEDPAIRQAEAQLEAERAAEPRRAYQQPQAEVDAANRVQSALSEAVQKELARRAVRVTAFNRTIGGYTLADKHYEAWQNIVIKRLEPDLRDLFNDPSYGRMSAADRQVAVEKEIAKVKREVREMIEAGLDKPAAPKAVQQPPWESVLQGVRQAVAVR